MASANFEKAVEVVRALTAEERRQLRQFLEGLPPGPPETQDLQDELDRRLLADGLLSSIPPPITDFTPYQNRKPVVIKGKPLSETIIEERR